MTSPARPAGLRLAPLPADGAPKGSATGGGAGGVEGRADATGAAGGSGPGVWTTRTLLAWVKGAFARKGLEEGPLMAELLLLHVLGAAQGSAAERRQPSRLSLYTDPDRPASPAELALLRGLVARALRDEPVQYLTGRAWFFGLELEVDSRVLIPRPCTELIVEHVLQGVRSRAPTALLRIADVCTGSGAIAVAIKKHAPGAVVIATDISAEALAVAERNARRHGVTIDLRCGDLLAPLRASGGDGGGERFDYIVSNPPYIPDGEWADVPANVKHHEPALALRGGADGLDLIRPLIAGAPDLLAAGGGGAGGGGAGGGGGGDGTGGTLLIETAASTADAVLALAESSDRYATGHIVRDLEGHPRMVVLTVE